MKLTRISIDNPVLATMMMVAFWCSACSPTSGSAVDQFPNVTSRSWWCRPTIRARRRRRSSPTSRRKIEEAVNTINGINTLTSRSL